MPRGVSGSITIVDGWPMHFKKKTANGEESLYHCIHRGRRLGCLASYSVHVSGTIRKIRGHDGHDQNSTETGSELARQELKNLAMNDPARPRALLQKLKRKFSPTTVCKLGDYNSMRRTIDLVRRREDKDRKPVDDGKGITGEYRYTITIHGCYFHLLKNWRKKATDLNIYEDMLDGGKLKEYWTLLKALPFIESSKIPEYFKEIEESVPPHFLDTDFSSYIKKFYVNGNVRSGPTYSPEFWSCFDVTSDGIHRTTNVVEVWHRLLAPVVTETNGLRKIRLTDLINALKVEEEQSTNDFDSLLIHPNLAVTKKRKLTNILKDIRLQKVLKNDPIPPNKPLEGLDFLKVISLAVKP
ncbi:unnamed protein product [Caenorhabditis brenneri]